MTLPGVGPDHLSGRTDDKGVVSFDYVVPKAVNGQPGEAAHVHFQATVADAAGQKQTASAEAPVSASPARIEVIPEAGELVQGVPNTVYVLVTRIDGTPAAHAHVALTNRNTNQNNGQVADENGAASFSIIPGWQGGPWGGQTSLEVVAVDDKGAEIARRDVRIPCGQSGDFLVRTDKAVYRGGDTLTLTAVGGAGAVYVDFIKDGQTMLTDTLETANGQGQASVDLPPELAGTVQVVAYRLDAKGQPVRKTRVVYVRPADEVHVACTLDKPEYKPGDRATLHLQLTDKAGQPCPGAVSLDGVDEAVFSVLSRRPGLERDFYTLEENLMAPVNRIHPWSPGRRRFAAIPGGAVRRGVARGRHAAESAAARRPRRGDAAAGRPQGRRAGRSSADG